MPKSELKKVMRSQNVSEEEAEKMMALARKKKKKMDMDSIIPSPKEVMDVGTGQLRMPEAEMKAEVSKDVLKSLQAQLSSLTPEDFMAPHKMHPGMLTVSAKDFKELAKSGVGTETYLLIRGPLVAHEEDRLRIGAGKIALVHMTKGGKENA